MSGLILRACTARLAPADAGRGGAVAIPGLEHLAPRARPPRLPVFCGDIPMRIARDGTWFYQGGPIGRKELVCLFASVLRREEDGGYWLVTPAERARIEVEDAPFLAVELFHCPPASRDCQGQVISFRTNVDEVVSAGPANPLRIARDAASGAPIPYVLVRDGLEARINRAVYYELVALSVPEVVDGRRTLGVWSQGAFFPLGDPEA